MSIKRVYFRIITLICLLACIYFYYNIRYTELNTSLDAGKLTSMTLEQRLNGLKSKNEKIKLSIKTIVPPKESTPVVNNTDTTVKEDTNGYIAYAADSIDIAKKLHVLAHESNLTNSTVYFKQTTEKGLEQVKYSGPDNKPTVKEATPTTPKSVVPDTSKTTTSDEIGPAKDIVAKDAEANKDATTTTPVTPVTTDTPVVPDTPAITVTPVDDLVGPSIDDVDSIPVVNITGTKAHRLKFTADGTKINLYSFITAINNDKSLKFCVNYVNISAKDDSLGLTLPVGVENIFITNPLEPVIDTPYKLIMVVTVYAKDEEPKVFKPTINSNISSMFK